jgi:hypothetical protein
VIAVHFREYWQFGLLFAILAPLQLGWAELVRRLPGARRLLSAGALGNLVVAAVWIASRTTGLPVGPHPGDPEPVGIKDLLATTDELVLAIVVWAIVTKASEGSLVTLGWVLAAASLVGALLPGGHA